MISKITKLIKRIIIGFVLGFLLIPIWASIFTHITEYSYAQIAPFPLWVTMTIGGIIGTIIILIVGNRYDE